MTKPFDVETARMYHDRYGSISPILAIQLDMALDEIDRLRQHSVVLNSTTYLAAQALGRVVPPADYEGDPKETVFALVEENLRLRKALARQTRLHAEWRENFRRTHKPR